MFSELWEPPGLGVSLGSEHGSPACAKGETEVSGWHQLLFRPSPARVPPNETSPLLSPINMGAWLVGKAPHLTGWMALEVARVNHTQCRSAASGLLCLKYLSIYFLLKRS